MDFFYNSGDSVYYHGVSGAYLIFHDNKKSGNIVFYQFLRTETDGKSDDTGTGQKRAYIDIEFTQ